MNDLTPFGFAIVGIIVAAFIFKWIFQQSKLIENQEKQIKLLEELVKNLTKEKEA